MFGTNYNDVRAAAGYVRKSQFEALYHFYKTATWTRQFAWLPHRCELTKKIIWLQSAYQGIAVYGWPENVVCEYHWHSYNEHIIWELRR